MVPPAQSPVIQLPDRSGTPAPRPTVTILGVTMPARDPVVAAVASGVVTGAGQAYNGDWLKGSLFFASNLLYVGGFVADLYTGQSAFRWSAMGVMLAAKGWSVWDAYQTNLDVDTPELSAEPDRRPTVALQWTF